MIGEVLAKRDGMKPFSGIPCAGILAMRQLSFWCARLDAATSSANFSSVRPCALEVGHQGRFQAGDLVSSNGVKNCTDCLGFACLEEGEEHDKFKRSASASSGVCNTMPTAASAVLSTHGGSPLEMLE